MIKVKWFYWSSIGEIAVAAELHDNAETTTDSGVCKWGEVANNVVVAQFFEDINLLERVWLRILQKVSFSQNVMFSRLYNLLGSFWRQQ